MQKRRVIWLLIAGVVLVGVLVVVWNRTREPEYGGKKLSEWVEALGSPSAFPHFYWGPPPAPATPLSAQSLEAILHIGSAAKPFLLSWIRYDRPKWKQKLVNIVSWSGIRTNSFCSFSDEKAVRRAKGAMFALAGFGLDAADAIPTLAFLATDPKTNAGCIRATEVLIYLQRCEPPGVAAMEWAMNVHAFSNPSDSHRALIRLLSSPDLRVRIGATNALRKTDPKALESANH